MKLGKKQLEINIFIMMYELKMCKQSNNERKGSLNVTFQFAATSALWSF